MDIHVKIPLTPKYLHRFVTIDETTIDLTIPLVDGTHRLTTDLVAVGTLKHFKAAALMASVTLWYRYDSAGETVTFCSSDLVSPDAMFVTTVPRGSSEFGHQHTYDGDDHPCGANPNWNYCTPLTPGLQTALQETVRKANALIIEEAEKLGLMVIVRTPPPVLTAEEYHQFSIVYHKGKFLEFFDAGKVYGGGHTIHLLGSYWVGVGTFSKKKPTYFANVNGSTPDYHPKGYSNVSWIKIWENNVNGSSPAIYCASHNFAPKDGKPPTSLPLFQCNTSDFVGGHVLKDTTTAAKPPTGPYDYLYIIPICKRHNSTKLGNKAYMKPVVYKAVVVLNNFLLKEP